VILPVDLYGPPVDMDAIMLIANTHSGGNDKVYGAVEKRKEESAK